MLCVCVRVCVCVSVSVSVCVCVCMRVWQDSCKDTGYNETLLRLVAALIVVLLYICPHSPHSSCPIYLPGLLILHVYEQVCSSYEDIYRSRYVDIYKDIRRSRYEVFTPTPIYLSS